MGLALLTGCKAVLLDPKGPIAADEKQLIITATVLMLIVVIPVIVLTLVFAWRYRAGNSKARFMPNWSHSTTIEIVIWLIPCLIILVLGTITWRSSHTLDPFRPLDSEAKTKPITIEVVALDWKWLFIYPDQHIATVNEVAFPANVPVRFEVTSDSVMNSFFIPALGSQIYAMAGMQTEVHLIADEPGFYEGMSANFSGDGFADMHFKARATSASEFKDWVAKVKQAPLTLDEGLYKRLAKPSEAHKVTYYSSVTDGLFKEIIGKYVYMPKQAGTSEL